MLAKIDWFLSQLGGFKAEEIPPEVMHRLAPIIEDPTFNKEKLGGKSKAAGKYEKI